MTIKTESDISLPVTIPQKPDIVLERILPYLMNCLTFRLNQLLNQDLRKLGLTISNWRILAVLDVNETASINELVEYAMIEQSTVSRLISRMEEDGLVRRDRIDEDGRVRSISMTEEGREKYDIVQKITLSHSERALIGLSGTEKALLESLIAKMRYNIETYPLPKNTA
jgi:MarR family transcriptional regulator, organic hydroperoxide resistance regulator